VEFIECTVNYDDLLEICEDKFNIDYSELVFNDAKDVRYFENLEYTSWILKEIIMAIDACSCVADKKNEYRVKKDIEELISAVRMMKKESKL